MLCCAADGTSWGALLFNSNGMDIVAREDRLSWRATGGVIDLVSTNTFCPGPEPPFGSGNQDVLHEHLGVYAGSRRVP